MKVEILEERLKSKDRETGKHYDLEAGDRVTVSDACGRRWCAAGWAKDLSGEVETGPRIVRGATLEPHNVTVKSKARGA